METETPVLEVHLDGPGIIPGRISLAALAVLARSLQSALDRISVVTQGGNSSRTRRIARGTRLSSAFELTRIVTGSTGLQLSPKLAAISDEVSPALSSFALLARGLPEILESESLENAPVGFDLGVVNALRPMRQLFNAYGVEAIRFVGVATGGREQHEITKSEFQRLNLIRKPSRPPISRMKGRLQMTDYKRYRCRVDHPGGGSVTVLFDEGMVETVAEHSRAWVEAELAANETTGGPAGLKLLALARLSEDETDEIAPPRKSPLPARTLEALQRRAARAHADMIQRPERPRSSLDD